MLWGPVVANFELQLVGLVDPVVLLLLLAASEVEHYC